MAWIDHAFASIPMIGLLIFVHEFGHFVLAKLCGVRVLKFSLGFGPTVGFGRHRLRWERGGTEYVIAWFPLGGFVRMLGQELPGDEIGDLPLPEDARSDEFLSAKPTWQKLAISAAGPAMNLLLPVFLFSIMLWAGMPRTAAVVGMVERGSPAQRAGVLPGDRIASIDGTPMLWWTDVENAIEGHAPGSLALQVERDGKDLELSPSVAARSKLDEFGLPTRIGWVGIDGRRLPALLGVPEDDSPAARAGLLSGDLATHLGGEEVSDWESLRRRYRAQRELHSDEVEVVVLRGRGEAQREEQMRVPVLGDLDALGVLPAAVLVDRVVKDSPAERAGLERGDLLLSVDGHPVGSFESFANTVRASHGRRLAITLAREGAVRRVEIAPEQRQVKGPLGIEGMEEKVYQIGILHLMAALPGAVRLDRERNPLVALPRAAGMTLDDTRRLLAGLGKLFTGEVGMDKLHGPIVIVQIARKSLDLGWQAYLMTMIFISINLGLLNLLPIPVLDGGQLLIYSIEGIRRGPISLRAREFVQQIGFVAIVLLMGLAFWNDLSVHWRHFVEWLGSGS